MTPSVSPPIWTPVGTREGIQVMDCSLHGEWRYSPGMLYLRDKDPSCQRCAHLGLAPEITGPADGEPF